MKKSSLALISSPALLAAFLLSSAPAQANPNSITINKDADLYTTSVVITNLRTQNADSVDQNGKPLDDRNDVLMSDRIGDLAISKLGCDCMGCRRTVAQLFSK